MTVFLLLLFATAACAVEAREPLSARVSPRRIEVGGLYGGSTVKVEGAVAAGSDVVVVVTGPDGETRFNRKGRFGPIWLNSGRVAISGAPSLFLRFSSAPAANGAALGLDKRSLMDRMRVSPPPPDAAATQRMWADYTEMKEDDGLYFFGDGGVRLTKSGAGTAAFALEFPWPKKAPPASYEVRVYEVRAGAVAGQISLPLEEVRTGFPAWLAAIAASRASLYGIAAVLFGAIAGFGIDQLATRIFGRKRISAH